MGKLWILIGFLSSGAAWGAATPCTEVEMASQPRWELGMSLQFLNPTALPNFDRPLPAYGPSLALPLLGNSLTLQALYGADNALTLQLLELGYQIRLETPYLTATVEGGTHFLRYAVSGNRTTFFGVYAGTGLRFDLARSFALNVTIKAYTQGKPILAFGGGFLISL